MYDTRSRQIEGAKGIKTYCKTRVGLCLIPAIYFRNQHNKHAIVLYTLTESGV